MTIRGEDGTGVYGSSGPRSVLGPFVTRASGVRRRVSGSRRHELGPLKEVVPCKPVQTLYKPTVLTPFPTMTVDHSFPVPTTNCGVARVLSGVPPLTVSGFTVTTGPKLWDRTTHSGFFRTSISDWRRPTDLRRVLRLRPLRLHHRPATSPSPLLFGRVSGVPPCTTHRSFSGIPAAPVLDPRSVSHLYMTLSGCSTGLGPPVLLLKQKIGFSSPSTTSDTVVLLSL